MKTCKDNLIHSGRKMMIMKTRKWLILAAVMFGFTIGMTGCLNGDNNSTSDHKYVPTYVTSNSGYVMIQSVEGTYYSATGSVVTVSDIGSYGFSSFIYDSKNQTTTDYPTANVYDWFPVADIPAYIRPGDLTDSYQDSIGKFYYYSPLSLNQRMFVSMSQKAPKEKVYTYEFICNADSTTKYGVPAIYIKAQSTSTTSTTNVEQVNFYALNLASVMNSYSRDTTVNNYKYRYVQLRVSVQVGNTTEGRPVFQLQSAEQPILIFDPVVQN